MNIRVFDLVTTFTSGFTIPLSPNRKHEFNLGREHQEQSFLLNLRRCRLTTETSGDVGIEEPVNEATIPPDLNSSITFAVVAQT